MMLRSPGSDGPKLWTTNAAVTAISTSNPCAWPHNTPPVTSEPKARISLPLVRATRRIWRTVLPSGQVYGRICVHLAGNAYCLRLTAEVTPPTIAVSLGLDEFSALGLERSCGCGLAMSLKATMNNPFTSLQPCGRLGAEVNACRSR